MVDVPVLAGPSALPRTIAITNLKGGVGKTTTTVNLAAALAELERTVLIVDMDHQAGATCALFGREALGAPAEPTVYDLLITPDADPHEIIQTVGEGIYILPSNALLQNAELELSRSTSSPQERLAMALAQVKRHFPVDYILIDCPPTLSFLNLNALLAAEEVLMPLAMSPASLNPSRQLFDTIQAIVDEGANPNLGIRGIVFVEVDERQVLDRQMMQSLREQLPFVFTTHIRKNVAIREAYYHHRSVLEYAPNSRGAEDYRALARELLQFESDETKELQHG